jgi:hypothetical protein
MNNSSKKNYLLLSISLLVLALAVVLLLMLTLSLPFSQDPPHIPITPTPSTVTPGSAMISPVHIERIDFTR